MALTVLGAPATKKNRGNPFTQLLYGALEQHGVKSFDFQISRLFSGHWDIVHIHWPELMVRKRASAPRLAVAMATTLVGLRVARARGAAVVWSLHNLRPHDAKRRRMYRWFYANLVKSIDGVACMSEHAKTELINEYPQLSSVPVEIVRHGHYRDWYDKTHENKRSARATLGLEEHSNILLCFGQVREYKQLSELARAFSAQADPNSRLVIVGEPKDESVERALVVIAATDPRIKLRLARVADKDVSLWFKAADVSLHGYSILNSGSAILALSFNVPVVMPSSPAASELQEFVGQTGLTLSQDSATDVIRCGEEVAGNGQPVEIDLEALSWDGIADDMARLYSTVNRNGKNTTDESASVLTSSGV